MQDLMDPIATPDQLFHDGNPADGTIGTLVTALWLNAVQGAARSVQAELKSLLVGLGGAIDPAKNDQLKTALLAAMAGKAPIDSPTFTGAAKAPTPDQFDATTSIATMAALQRALGNMAGSSGFSASGNLTAAMTGKIVTVGMLAANQVLTLPALNTLPEGGKFVLQNLGGYAFNVQRSGTDTITTSGTALTLVTVGTGEDATFTKTNGGWIFSGRASIGRGFNFSANFGSSGYQRLPSGLIIQWIDYANANAVANGIYGVSWPISFPNAFINAQICNVNSGNGLFVWNNSFYSLGGINLQVSSGGSVRCNVLAIGW